MNDVGSISNADTVDVFNKSLLTWKYNQTLYASDAARTSVDEQFGSAVLIFDGTTFYCGAHYKDTYDGAVYHYQL